MEAAANLYLVAVLRAVPKAEIVVEAFEHLAKPCGLFRLIHCLETVLGKEDLEFLEFESQFLSCTAGFYETRRERERNFLLEARCQNTLLIRENL